MSNPAAVADCDNCGADLYDGVTHDCDVTGSTVVATWIGQHEHTWRVKGFESVQAEEHTILVTRACERCPAEYKQYEIGYISGGPFRVEPYEAPHDYREGVGGGTK